VTVWVNLTDSFLHVPCTRHFRTRYNLISAGTDVELMNNLTLLIQPLSPGTMINTCPFRNKKDNLGANSVTLSSFIPDAMRCSDTKIPSANGLLLNNVSLLQGMEISSDKPVAILLGRKSNLSLVVREGWDHGGRAEGGGARVVWSYFPRPRDPANRFPSASAGHEQRAVVPCRGKESFALK